MATTTLTLPTSTSITLHASAPDRNNETSIIDIRRSANSAGQAINPQTWPTDFRLVPAFRPVNLELDQTERPYGANILEYTFISVMMQGVRMQSVSPTHHTSAANAVQNFTLFWEATGARWWPGLTRWKIGGEW